MLSVLDLFSGIRGFSLGLERAGMQTVAFCEIDPYCHEHLAWRWPDVPIHKDIQRLDGNQYAGTVDLICGGFPCQDISYQGKGAGITGKRSGLWKEYARLIGEIRPRYVIVENTAALIDRGLGQVLADLAALRYDAEWHCIPAARIGAPHLRERIFVIAHPSGIERLYQPYLEEEAKRLCDHGHPWQTCPWDAPEAKVCSVDDGIPDRVVQSEKLGNAVVPQIPELIGRAILAYEQQLEMAA